MYHLYKLCKAEILFPEWESRHTCTFPGAGLEGHRCPLLKVIWVYGGYKRAPVIQGQPWVIRAAVSWRSKTGMLHSLPRAHTHTYTHNLAATLIQQEHTHTLQLVRRWTFEDFSIFKGPHMHTKSSVPCQNTHPETLIGANERQIITANFSRLFPVFHHSFIYPSHNPRCWGVAIIILTEWSSSQQPRRGKGDDGAESPAAGSRTAQEFRLSFPAYSLL
jgi:hypothetical protein